MYSPTTYPPINSLLEFAELKQITELRATATFLDGRSTANNSARNVKNNFQINPQCGEYTHIQHIVLNALNKNHLFRTAVLPKSVYPFLFSKYNQGMSYGWHVDSSLIGNIMRADVAMAIFLNSPDEYEGMLELETPAGNILYKLEAGDAICYPCTQLHQVRKVTKGERHVAVKIMGSIVKQTEQRKILYDVQQSNKLLANHYCTS